jgi:hypothetical protein
LIVSSACHLSFPIASLGLKSISNKNNERSIKVWSVTGRTLLPDMGVETNTISEPRRRGGAMKTKSSLTVFLIEYDFITAEFKNKKNMITQEQIEDLSVGVI